MARMRSRSASLRFFSRCTWIRSEPGNSASAADRGVEIAMFLLQARQKLPQLALFLVGHCHRWFAWPPGIPAGGRSSGNYRVFHKEVQALGKPQVNK